VGTFVDRARRTVTGIVSGDDPRLLVVVGPCSIHDPEAALDYASRLAAEAKVHAHSLFLVMRTYLEKPRTVTGWRGLLHDPALDGSCDVVRGLRVARQLLVDVSRLGVPCATEFLDPLACEYVADLIAWAAIGARTSESPIHRQLASGLALPIGFKNSTSGDVRVAVHAVVAASEAQRYLAMDADGSLCVVEGRGNPHCHVVLRGANQRAQEADGSPRRRSTDPGTNFDEDSLAFTSAMLRAQGLPPRLMVDCSHGNSQFDPGRQLSVIESVAEQIATGDAPILGVMIESNLVAGKQAVGRRDKVVYGQSVTDPCLGWAETVQALSFLAAAVQPVLARRTHARIA